MLLSTKRSEIVTIADRLSEFHQRRSERMYLFRRPPAINFLAEKDEYQRFGSFGRRGKQAIANNPTATEQKKRDAISEEKRLLGKEKVMNLSLFGISRRGCGRKAHLIEFFGILY